MIKNKKIKKPSKNNQTERRILWCAVVLLFVLQLVSVGYIIQLRNNAAEMDERTFATYINESEKERYKYPVIDVSENRVYIPEARVYLPLNDVTRNLRYDYSNNKPHAALYLSNTSIVGAQTKEDDPSCDKIVSFTGDTTVNTTFSVTGELEPSKDGFKYLLAHSKDGCKIYFGTAREDLINAAKEIQNY